MCDNERWFQSVADRLDFDDTPDPAHQARLQEHILDEWSARSARPGAARSMFRTGMTTAGALLQHHRARLAVAAGIALAVFVALSLMTGSPDGAATVWALEQSIQALGEVKSVRIEGVDQSGSPFRCWVQPKPGGQDLGRLRFEGESAVVVVDDDMTHLFLPAANEFRILEGHTLQGVRNWYLALKLRPWVGDALLQRLQRLAGDWQESYGQDEQTGRECVFVTCNYRPQGMSFQFVFDLETKLVVRFKQWCSLDCDGPPDLVAHTVIYNEDMGDDLFVLEPPEGARVIDAVAKTERQALLEEAERIYQAGRFAEAIAGYTKIYERYPDWNYAETALMMIGLCHSQLDHQRQALEFLEKAVREYGDLRGWSESTYFYLGSQYARAGRTDEALEAFRRCIELCRGVRDPDAFPWKHAREAIARLESER